MEHGGDILSFQPYYHGELVDFSSNINPLGSPEGLKEELTNSFRSVMVYPDIKYRKLKKSLSVYLGCSEENILLGNGAVELINNFIISAKRVVIVTPCFIEYEKRALILGKPVKRLTYKKDFSLDETALARSIVPGDLLILGNPNNPTGLRIDKEKLKRIYTLVRENGGYLLLDEAFYEFCTWDYDSIELFKSQNYECVGVIRAATKFFALPGIRLGYGCVSKGKVKEMESIGLPWSINCFADIAGQFILKDKNYIDRSKSYIEKERDYLLKELSKIDWIQPYNTHANFILIKLIGCAEDDLFDYLLGKGILIRKCSNFTGLSNDYIRIAIKDRGNNIRLVKALTEFSNKN